MEEHFLKIRRVFVEDYYTSDGDLGVEINNDGSKVTISLFNQKGDNSLHSSFKEDKQLFLMIAEQSDKYENNILENVFNRKVDQFFIDNVQYSIDELQKWRDEAIETMVKNIKKNFLKDIVPPLDFHGSML